MIGTLYTVDFEGVEDHSLLEDPDRLAARMAAAIAASGLTAIGKPLVHRFDPQGITYLVILSQSHLAVHTWPERQLMTADFFTCGDLKLGLEACAYLEKAIPCCRVFSNVVERQKEYSETVGSGEGRVFRIEDVVCQKDTKFQRLEIIKTESYGLTLFLDRQRQSSEVDEFIYHEMLVHPILLRHPCPKRIFIAGGGEGAVAREVLRHHSIERIIQVDIDGDVIDACRRYLPSWSAGSYEDPRLQLLLQDARSFIRDTPERFDIAILDLPEYSPESPARELFTSQFYRLVKSRLNPEGLVGLQVGGPIHPAHVDKVVWVANLLRESFDNVVLYVVPELRWCFAVCSQQRINNDLFDIARVSGPLRYYNAGIHNQLGVLPNYIADRLS